MSLRSLVPALGLLASLAPMAHAADTPVFTPRGWVDSIFTLSDNDADDSDTLADFTAEGLFGAKWKVGSKVSGEVALKGTTEPDGAVTIPLAYVDYAINDMFSIRFGQSYGPIGYLSSEPTGLSTITKTPVAIDQMYGPAGRGITLTATKDAFVGSFSIFDGGSTDADTDLLYLLDLSYNFPEGKGFINFEAFIDVGAVELAGSDEDLVHLAVSGDYKVTDPLKIGAELLYEMADEDTKLGFLAFGNHALPIELSSSVTLMVQYLQNDIDATGATPSDLSVQAALLTSPTGSSNFGVNFELGYLTSDADDGSDKLNSYWASTEFLLSF